VTDVPPPGGYPQQPQQPGGYEPPPQQPAYQPPPAAPQQPAYQPPPAAPQQPVYQQPPPGYPQQPGQFQPVNPPPASSGNGCLKAFLIVLVISIILGVVGVVASIFLIGNAVDTVSKSFGVADAADYDIPAGDIKCSVDDFGSMKASGTITNKKNARQAYQVKVDFSDADNVKLGTSTALTGALNSGQKGSWNVTDFDSTAVGKSITCKVAEVDYWLT
jgi:hypothetical protein